VCRPKHVEQLRNTGIINSTTRLHLVGSFYEIYITMHGSMNINVSVMYSLDVRLPDGDLSVKHVRWSQFMYNL